jgi:hypothetical protein
MSEAPGRSFTYKPPLRFFLEEAFYGLVLASFPGVVVIAITAPPWRYLGAVPFAALAIWSVRRTFRIRLLVTEDEVRITNRLRTYVIPWADVVAVSMMAIGKLAPVPTGRPTIAFWRRGRGWVKAQATPSRERDLDEFQAAVMALAPPSVRALTPPPDWWADQDRPRRASVP